jgi:hypothetical protein
MQQVAPTANEIATGAYRLWLESGCPVGLDQEYWFRAEAMLRNARADRREQESGRPWIPRCDARTGSTKPDAFTLERWAGHWEIWEREWGDARWVWDVRDSWARVAAGAG